jgi:hypothetical protein
MGLKVIGYNATQNQTEGGIDDERQSTHDECARQHKVHIQVLK